VQVWDAGTQKLLREFDMGGGGLVSLLAVGNYVFGGGYSGTLFVWDATTHEPLYEVAAHADAIRTLLAMGEDHVLTTSGGRDGSMAIWRVLGEGQQLEPCASTPMRRKDAAGGGSAAAKGIFRRRGSGQTAGAASGNFGSDASLSLLNGGVKADRPVDAERDAILDLPRAYNPMGFELALPLPEDNPEASAALAAPLPGAALARLRAWAGGRRAQLDRFHDLASRAPLPPQPPSGTAELRELVQGGVPASYRGWLWERLIHVWLERHDNVPAYDERSQSYHTDVWRARGVVVQQVELDLHRTFPTNRFFSSPQTRGYLALRRTLVAFSQRNLETGYCQGFNFITGFALLLLPEDVAFW
jgi:hypothetical protein